MLSSKSEMFWIMERPREYDIEPTLHKICKTKHEAEEALDYLSNNDLYKDSVFSIRIVPI